jgi:hypothetical protein
VLAGAVRDDRLNTHGQRVNAAALFHKLACCVGPTESTASNAAYAGFGGRR